MKNLSKVLAVVLALVMALSMVSFAAYTDVAADANYTEAVTVLSSLDMLKGYEDGTFKPEGEITRAEFAMVICRLLGYGATAEIKAATQFPDVTSEHWASGAIALAASQKIVNGFPDGTFKPEENVTYEQAIKMVVAALGYNIVAEGNGGYPGGYQIVAAQAGILDGITDGKSGVAASRAVVAQLAYNALEVPMLGQIGFGTNVEYDYTNALFLNKIGVVKFYGTVEATAKSDSSLDANQVKLKMDKQITAIKGDSEINKVAADSTKATPDLSDYNYDTTKTYLVSEAVAEEANALLDYEVEAYVKNAASKKPELVAVVKRNTGNTELTFKSEDVIKCDASALEIYTEAEPEDGEKFELDIKKIYLNGRLTTNAAYDTELAVFANSGVEADIRLLENNDDEKFDIAYVTVYVDYVVDSLVASKGKITNKTLQPNKAGFTTVDEIKNFGKNLVFDAENEKYNFEIIKDGKKVDFSAIAVNDVLSIAGGVDSTNKQELAYGTVIVNTQTVAGKVNSVLEDEKVVTVDGVDYDYNESAANAGITEALIGNEATFYINARGVICGLDETKTTSDLKYGFITSVGEYKVGAQDGTWEVRLMDSEGKWAYYTLAAKYELNGAKKDAKDFGTDASSYITAGRIDAVVAYELNAEGKIDVLYVGAGKDGEFELDTNISGKYNADTNEISGKAITEDTVIFDAIAPISEDTVSVISVAELVDGDTYTFTPYYTADEEDAPTVLLNAGAAITGKIDFSSDFMVVTKKAATANAEGDKGVEITGLVNGETVKIFASTETDGAEIYDADYSTGVTVGTTLASSDDASDIAKGDVIIYTTTANGEAAKIVRLINTSEIETALKADTVSVGGYIFGGEATVDGTDYGFYIGYAVDYKNDKVYISTGSNDWAGRKGFKFSADATVAEIDFFYREGEIKITASDASSINVDCGVADGEAYNDGDIVIFRTIGSTVIDAVVFKSNK